MRELSTLLSQHQRHNLHMKNLNNLKQSWLQQIEPRTRMLMWSRKRQSTAQGLTVTSSPKKTQQVGHVASVFDPPSPPPQLYHSSSAIRLWAQKRHKENREGEMGDHKARPAVSGSVWAHTENIQANSLIVRMCDSVIVLHPNRAGWRKVPLHSPWLLLLLPGSKASWDW